MVALILTLLAQAAPVYVPGPQLQPLDRSNVRRVPSFSGTGKSSTLPSWAHPRFPALAPDGEHLIVDDYDTLSGGTLAGGRAWSLPTLDGSDPLFVDDALLTRLDSEHFALRDLDTGRIRARFDGEVPFVAALSADRERLAIETDGVQIVDMEGRVLQSWPIASSVRSLQFSRDGKRLLICDGGVRLWDLESDRIVFFEAGQDWGACAADPDLKRAYIAREQGFIERIELEWGAPRTAWDLGEPVYQIAWVAPDIVYVATDSPFTTVVDLGRSAVVAELEGRGERISVSDGQLIRLNTTPAAWSWPQLVPQSTRPRFWSPGALAATDPIVAIGDNEGSVLLYRGEALVGHLWGFATEVTDLDFHGKTLAIGDGRGNAWVVRSESGEVIHQIPLTEGEVSVQFSPDGEVLIVAVENEEDPSWMEIWDTERWERLYRSGHQRLGSFAFPSHGRWFLASGADSTDLQIIGTRTGATLRALDIPYRLDWSRVGLVDDQQIAVYSIGEDDSFLWRPPAEPVPIDAWGFASAFSPSGRMVAVDSGEALVVYDSITGRELHQSPARDIDALAWSPDGHTLHSAQSGGAVRSQPIDSSGSAAARDDLSGLELADLGPVPRWTALRSVRVGRGASALAIAEDGRIAVALGSHGVQLFSADGEKLQVLGAYREFSRTIEQIGFAPDGALVSSDHSHTAEVWRDGQVVQTQPRCAEATLQGDTLECADSTTPTTRGWRGVIELNGQPLPSQPGAPTRSELSPDHSQLAVGSEQLAVVWEVHSRKPIGVLEANAKTAMGWTPDGKQLLTLGGGELVWWEKR